MTAARRTPSAAAYRTPWRLAEPTPSSLRIFQGSRDTTWPFTAVSSRHTASSARLNWHSCMAARHSAAASTNAVCTSPSTDIALRRAAEGLPAQRGDARHRVAEVVGEVRVVARQERLVREARVLAERHLPHQEVAQGVRAEVRDELVRPHDVADGLGHLLRVAQPPAVRPHGRRQRQAGREEERRPEHRVEAQDVLADEVNALGPFGWSQNSAVVRVVRGAEAERGDVVRERVEPDVDDVARVPRKRDPPLHLRARDGEVVQPALHERDDFRQPASRAARTRDAARSARAAAPRTSRGGRRRSPRTPTRSAVPWTGQRFSASSSFSV